MPRQQINTPEARIAVTGDGGTDLRPLLSGSDADAGGRIEMTPALGFGWNGREGDPDTGAGLGADAIVTAHFEVAEDEVLRAADAIRHQRAEHPTRSAPYERIWQFTTQELSRAELNLLIRVARRARDKVFGADD